jgi:hypothetical protein
VAVLALIAELNLSQGELGEVAQRREHQAVVGSGVYIPSEAV